MNIDLYVQRGRGVCNFLENNAETWAKRGYSTDIWHGSCFFINPYRSGPYLLLNRSEGGGLTKLPPLSRKPLQIETQFFFGSSSVFLEKITFSSHSRQTAPQLLFSGQPLNIKTAVERPIFKLGLPNFEYSFYFL